MKKYLLSLSTAIALASIAPSYASQPFEDPKYPAAGFFKGYALGQDEADIVVKDYVGGDSDAVNIIGRVTAVGTCSKNGIYVGQEIVLHSNQWNRVWLPLKKGADGKPIYPMKKNRDGKEEPDLANPLKEPRPGIGTGVFRVLLKYMGNKDEYKEIDGRVMATPVELKIDADRKKEEPKQPKGNSGSGWNNNNYGGNNNNNYYGENAQQKAAKEAAEKAAKDKAANEKAAKDAADKAAKEKAAKDAADKAAKDKAAREKEYNEWWDNYYKQQAKDAEDKAAREKAAKDAADRAAKEAADRAAKEKADKEWWDNYRKQQDKAAADRAAREKAAKDAADRAAREKAEKEKANQQQWWNNNNNYGGNNNNNYYGGYEQPKKPEQPKYEYKPAPWFDAAFRTAEPAYPLENVLMNLKIYVGKHITAAELNAIPAGTNPAVLADLYYPWLMRMDNGWQYNYEAFQMDKATAATFYYAKFVLPKLNGKPIAFKYSPNTAGVHFDAEQYLLNYPHVRKEAMNHLADPHLYAAVHYLHFREIPEFANLTDKKCK